MTKNEGVIYIAIGQKFIKEAIHSCFTLKKYNNIHCTLFTNEKSSVRVFDDVILLDDANSPWKLKIQAMLLTPYQNTLYIDSDTEIFGNIMYPFELLKNNDFILAPVRDFDGTLVSFTKKNIKRTDLPRLNTGVIYFKKQSTKRFLNNWYQRIGKHKSSAPVLGVDDQSEFNDMISEYLDKKEKISIGVLSNKEYNCRMFFLPHMNKLEKKNIKIIHQHYLYIKDVRKYYYNFEIYKRIIIEKMLVIFGKKLKN